MNNKRKNIDNIKNMNNKKNTPMEKRHKKEINSYNKIDPILLCPLGKHTFKFCRPTNGIIIIYNIKSLIKYMLVSGNFSEPETKIEFSDDDLKQLDEAAIKAGFKLQSTIEAKKNKKYYEDKKHIQDSLLSLEMCTGEVITEILKLIENHEYKEEAEIILITYLFPVFIDHYTKIKNLDKKYALQSIKTYITFIQGPENKPTTKRNDILTMVIKFLNYIKDN
jgi:hypothetical protein